MECQNLLERLLTKDAKMRITIPQIKEHPWVLKFDDCKLLQDTAFIRSLKAVNLDDLDQGVIGELRTLGYETVGLQQELKAGAISSRTAAYKMLRKMQTSEELRRWQTAKSRAIAPGTIATAAQPKTDKLPLLQGRKRTQSLLVPALDAQPAPSALPPVSGSYTKPKPPIVQPKLAPKRP
jgi:serine/threonine protein kinase